MSYYLVMLNALRDRPGLFSDETWNKLTAYQIRAAQSHHFSRAPLPREADPVFTAAQVKDRNPDMASAELAPVLKANLAARAKAAPATLVTKHALLGLSYDDKTGKLVADCCYSRPRARPGLPVAKPVVERLHAHAERMAGLLVVAAEVVERGQRHLALDVEPAGAQAHVQAQLAAVGTGAEARAGAAARGVG